MEAEASPVRHGLSTPVAAIGVVIIMAGVAAYLLAAAGLGIVPYWAGFLFSLLFGAFEKMDRQVFLPTITGSFAGIGNAAALYYLPQLLPGGTGLAVALAITLAATFCLLRGWLPSVINSGYLLFVTVATIPELQQPPRFGGMLAAVVLGAAFMVAVMVATGLRSARAGATSQPES